MTDTEQYTLAKYTSLNIPASERQKSPGPSPTYGTFRPQDTTMEPSRLPFSFLSKTPPFKPMDGLDNDYYLPEFPIGYKVTDKTGDSRVEDVEVPSPSIIPKS